jgi:hypothetical protein
MLENIRNRALRPIWGCRPIFLPQVAKVRKERMGRVALKGFFDQPGEGIDGKMKV